MPKKTVHFVCNQCGESFLRWMGKCTACGAFNTLQEFRETAVEKTAIKGINLTEKNEKSSVLPEEKPRIKTHIDELDRVTGGGFFPGSLVLFGGHPGVGKSSLALQIFSAVPDAMYFSGEESREQVLHRSKRLQIAEKKWRDIFSTHSVEDIVETTAKEKPSVVIVDSIQMVGLSHSNFGSVSQIRDNAEIFLKLAKSSGSVIILIGHVTKNDELAGPKMLEHMVDLVLHLEGERQTGIRLLRSPKNRFGSAQEIGVFEMRNEGLMPLKNPSDFFLAERLPGSPGSTITAVREGNRNLLLELQGLSARTNFGQPRRTASGFDIAKFHLLLAVVSRFTPFGCEAFDAYANVVGGLRISDPAADLALIAAVLSSRIGKEISADTMIFGEVGLGGEIRRVPHAESRILEAEKLGFKRVICPPEKFENKTKIHVEKVHRISDLIRILWPK